MLLNGRALSPQMNEPAVVLDVAADPDDNLIFDCIVESTHAIERHTP
jgi:hypothetical protein